jgi:NDP-sugar pyrophosphorylase family protein
MTDAKKIHLVIPMSGQGTRFKNAGYMEPKPLISVSGRSIIERLLSCFPSEWTTTFVLADNHASTPLPDLLKSLRPHGRQLSIEAHTRGPGHAILSAIEDIDDDAPVLVSYCDYGMSWDHAEFERFVRVTECDACVVSYRGFHAHYLNPLTYAYSRLENDRVVEVREKGSFTLDRENEFASSGAYYFKSAALLRRALSFQKRHELVMNGELYTSLTVEALLQLTRATGELADVRIFEIPFFYQWGTPSDLQDFEYWEKTYATYYQTKKIAALTDQILMPMAGFGSRFKDLTPVPKPLIEIGKVPMYRRALASLPQANKSVFVSLESLKNQMSEIPAYENWVALESTPPGQALTTEQGLQHLVLERDVVVSSCDHAICLDTDLWQTFRDRPDCDAAIFVVSGFPGATRHPKSYSYVVAREGTGRCPEVAKISVKSPTTNEPRKESLLVGTFWFRTAQLLADGIQELKKSGERVNGELYLDSIFTTLIQQGRRVRMIPLDGYINWGDPTSLSEALYWADAFGGARLERRSRFPGTEL